MSHKYPKVNYIGNKEKLVEWIFDSLPSDATSFFDAFSGGASVSYEAKKRGYKVISNDVLAVNYLLAKSLIENSAVTLDSDDVRLIFSGEPQIGYMTNNYSYVYYFAKECMELDLFRANIEKLENDYKKALALTLMRRAMIRKMPYSRFTINWAKIKQLRDEDYSYAKYKRRRAYHNQSFQFHFLAELDSYNQAVFDNGQINIAYNQDILKLSAQLSADIVYLDPPYIGTMNNYYGFYGVLDEYICGEKSVAPDNDFTDRTQAISQFERLFEGLKNYKYWVLSYNNRAVPSKDELLEIMGRYSSEVTVVEKPHTYKITGKQTKNINMEYLFIAKYKM